VLSFRVADMSANSSLSRTRTTDEIAAELCRLSPEYATTPLLELPKLAAHLGIGQILAKDEGRRMLGSFKSLGGTYAGLRALARVAGTDIAGLLDPTRSPISLPRLLCASDGNHGLAVAAAARLANASARVFLHVGVSCSRARRIEVQGAEITWVNGTYDDAVDAAEAAARNGDGILVADTTDDPTNPLVLDDVIAGYRVIAAEIRHQVEACGYQRPTHLFVQAGVGGLASAMAEGLAGWMGPTATLIVTEPETTACVAMALAQGAAVRVHGDLATSAEMLACGKASTPAVDVLRRHSARAVVVSEVALAQALCLLRRLGGPGTTPSGAAGLAGLVSVLDDGKVAAGFGLDAASRVLILITEGAVEGEGS
jgi:diaminopropionate ammonia-lyase